MIMCKALIVCIYVNKNQDSYWAPGSCLAKVCKLLPVIIFLPSDWSQEKALAFFLFSNLILFVNVFFPLSYLSSWFYLCRHASVVNFRPIICGFLIQGWFWSSSYVAVPPAGCLHTYTLCIAFTYVHEQGFCMLHITFQSLHVFLIMTTHRKYVPTKHILNVFIQHSMCLPLRCFLYIEKPKIRLPVLILSI